MVRCDTVIGKRAITATDYLCLALGAVCYPVAGVFHGLTLAREGGDMLALVPSTALLAVMAGALLALVRSMRRSRYLLYASLHAIASLAAVPYLAGIQVAELAAFTALIVPLCFHNPYPWNLRACAAVVASALLIRAAVFASRGMAAVEILGQAGTFILAPGLTGAACSFMARYREYLADHQTENERLDSLVERLTRANLGYQQYAATVEESTATEERRRITRDIHDIVGYTLTNNITMMEAVTDMMSENPLGIPSLMEAARENALEGLSRIREALRLLRESPAEYPTGLRGVQRLVGVFRHATGIRVDLVQSGGPLDWRFSTEVDQAVYHIVQESLMNSFRHGRATLIRIFLDMVDGALELKVRDNGVGAYPGEVKEGIGLAGMRERVAALGGRFLAEPVPGGFAVHVSIPVGARDGGD